MVENEKAVLDFSVGDSYSLILGDIVKQIPYSSVTPSILECFDDLPAIRPSGLPKLRSRSSKPIISYVSEPESHSSNSPTIQNKEDTF